MFKYSIFFVVLFLTETVFTEKLLLCYYGSWATYRNGNGACGVDDLSPTICTHLIYTFVGLNDDATIRIMDPWLELPDNYGRDNFGRFNRLKKLNPDLKTIVAIGGWNEGSARYSKMANDPVLRAKFVKEAANFTLSHGFDGFDLDWEYPGQRDSPNGEKDIQAHAKLIKELREEFDKHGLLLTAAVAAAESSVRKSYDIAALSKYLHYIHVMSYDFHGAWDSETGHNAALRQYNSNLTDGASFDIETVYKFWLNQGAPKDKLIMGLPLYGRTFRLSNPQNVSVGAPASGAGIAGQYSFENGMIGLNELCEKRLTESWPEIWDEKADVPYTYKSNDWITYDDRKSLQIKVEYALKLDLAGVMVWSIETDDFRGICHGQKYAYLQTVNRAIGREVPEELTTPTNEIPETSQPATAESTTTSPNLGDSTTPSAEEICNREGFVRNKNDCSVFYNCIKINENKYIKYTFKCPFGLYFDDIKLVCNFPNLVQCDI